MEKISTPLVVVALALISVEGRVLVQQRPLNKAHGGLWEFPGGKVEPGETPEAALVREIDEELGVIVSPDDLQPLTFASSAQNSGQRALVLLLYTTMYWHGVPQALEPGTQVAWVSGDALPGLAMPPLDVPLAQTLIPVLEGVAKAKRPA